MTASDREMIEMRASLLWLLSNVHGMNFVRQDLRLAMYLRDGCACGYCNASISDTKARSPYAAVADKKKPPTLTLDHIIPRSKGGGDGAENLVTSCKSCNDFRGLMEKKGWSLKDFVNDVAKRTGRSPEKIMQHVTGTATRPVDREMAKKLISRQGSAAKVIASGDAKKAMAKIKVSTGATGDPMDDRTRASGRRGPGAKGGWRSGAGAKRSK